MKVSAITLSVLAGSALANPVVVERDNEPRQILGLPILGGGAPAIIPTFPGTLPTIPNVPLPGAPTLPGGDIRQTVQTLLEGILFTVVNLLQGLPNAATPPTLPVPFPGGGLPGLPAIGGVTPTLPVNAITPQQLLALVQLLQFQLGNLTNLAGGIPLNGAGLPAGQIGDISAAVARVQALVAPIISGPLAGIPGVSAGGLGAAFPGGLTNLATLSSLTGALGGLSSGGGPLATVQSVISNVLGSLLGSVLGNLLGGLTGGGLLGGILGGLA